ncbi:MAG: type I glutamate--ammonia ligase [Desulfobacteraceae bacterium]|jgi:glutamine synthetase
MFASLSDAEQFITSENIEILDLKYIDFGGRWRHVTLPASTRSLALLDKGVGFDGSSVGYKKIHSGDMALIPDLSTAVIDPFWKRKALSFICDIVEADSKQTFAFDPRNLARRAEEYLSRLGWVDKSYWGPELEFNVFDKVSYSIGVTQSSYEIRSGELSGDSEYSNNGFHILPMRGYHATPPTDSSYEMRSEIAAYLEEMGIEVKYHHHEVGGAGELEIELPMAGLLESGDRIMLIKYVAKMIGRKWGKSVTFMPKPIYGDGGNGMHVHQNLWKGNRNLFYDRNGYSGLSAVALSYITGLLEHAPALLAFTNPSTNSYRRLVPGFEAPTNLFFSAGNRSSAIRIPTYATTEEEKRIEFRTPDATCNIYFCLAAQLLAGLDGIAKKMQPEDYGPIDEDIHTWSKEKIRRIKSLPASLEEALEGLKRNHEFLLRGEIFSQDLLHSWIEYKIKEELNPIRERPHPFEFALYYDA